MSIMLPQLLLLVHMHRNPPSLMRGKTQGTTDLREANPTEKKQEPLHGDRTDKSLRHERGNDREIGVLSENEWDDRSSLALTNRATDEPQNGETRRKRNG